MGVMREEQAQVAHAVGSGLEGLQQLLNHTAGLQAAMGRSLYIQVIVLQPPAAGLLSSSFLPHLWFFAWLRLLLRLTPAYLSLCLRT